MGTLEIIQSYPSYPGTAGQSRLPKPLLIWVLDISEDGDFTAFPWKGVAIYMQFAVLSSAQSVAAPTCKIESVGLKKKIKKNPHIKMLLATLPSNSTVHRLFVKN